MDNICDYQHFVLYFGYSYGFFCLASLFNWFLKVFVVCLA